MRKIFAVIIAFILLVIIVIILLPHFIKEKNNNIIEEEPEIICEFNYEEIENELAACLYKARDKNLKMIINNVNLSETKKKVKINYDNISNTLELYFDDQLTFSENKIDTKKIQNITIFNNELFVLAYYTQSNIEYDTGNVIAYDNLGNLVFQLKEDEAYYSISNINSNENKINFSKYYFTNTNEIAKENYETSYLGENEFSDYNLIENETINISE